MMISICTSELHTDLRAGHMSRSIDAQLFKTAFEDAQKSNAAIPASSSEAPAASSETAPAATSSEAPAAAASTSEVHGDQVRQKQPPFDRVIPS